MKTLALRFALTALALPALTLTASAQTSKNDVVEWGAPQPLKILTTTGEHAFSVEEAKTLDQQARGMMFRETMDADSGMIFEFEEPKIATIWMKNTPLPLDILFVRSNGKILKIEHSHTPYTLRSTSSEAVVAAVVELKGGESKSRGIKPGDTVVHPFFDTAP